MKIIKIISLILFALFTQSCEKEFTPDLEKIQEKIVVNGLFNNTEVLSVTVTKSIALLEEIEVEECIDARVSIYEDNNYIDDMTYGKEANDIIGSFKADFVPTAGKEYRIVVDEEGLAQGSATAEMPYGVDILDAVTSAAGDNAFEFSFTLNDLAEKNYYFLKMYVLGYDIDSTTQERTNEHNYYVQIPSSALPDAQEYVDNGYLFSDDTFDENNNKIAGIARTGILWPLIGPNREIELDTSKVYIHLQTLSEEAYKFYSSHAIVLNDEIDAIGEDNVVYENIENGFGIFAGVYISEVAVDVQ